MRYIMHLFIFMSFITQANTSSFPMQRIIFSADIVASACHVRVDADGTRNNLLSFPPYNKSTRQAVQPRDFVVRLYESGATTQGCSAFLVGKIATLKFGNPGQLDSGGVITRGAGDGVRIDIRAIDGQADWHERLTGERDRVNYPVKFASQGQFRFSAQPLFPSNVRAGEYNGSLSFVVTYQ